MARLPRFNIPGQPQHVIIRGNNKTPIFLRKKDYRFYLETMGKAINKYPCDLHAYVLMTNHVHLLITPQKENALSKAIQSIGRVYVQYFNLSYNRTGTLWEGRYKATLIDSEAYAFTCYRYIELNPVRAGMVAHPGEYYWSSYHYNALGVKDPILTPHYLYHSLGCTARLKQESYRSLFDTHIPLETIENIREMTNKAWVLGNPDFIKKIQNQLERPLTACSKGGDRKSKAFCLSRND